MTEKKWRNFERRQASPDELGWGGFLRLTRHQMQNRYEDGSASDWYQVESVHPPFKDAVVLALYTKAASGPWRVLLRRAPRPAAALRADDPLLRGLDQTPLDGGLWELPSGGVEIADLMPGGPGVAGRAVIEAREEAGYDLCPDDLAPLGPAPFTAPAFCPERLHYFAARIDPQKAKTPTGDGHPLEEGAERLLLDLDQAFQWCQDGRIIDLKTETGLNRLANWLHETQGG